MNGKTFSDVHKPCGNRANPDPARIAKTDVPSRRLMLRGALAVGCGLLVPAALLGCDAGKEADSTGEDGAAPTADPASAALPGPNDAEQSASAKISQVSVQYQTQPQGEQNCSNCRYFIVESNTCQKVEGDISPEGWCALWAKVA